MSMLRIGIVGLSLFVAPVLTMGAQQGTAAALTGGEKAHVSLVLRVTPSGRGTVNGASTDAFLALGERSEGAVGIGIESENGLEPSRWGACDGTGSSGRIGEFAQRWIATYAVASLTMTGVTIHLDLKHERGQQDQPGRVLLERHETLSLEWGKPAVLDFVAFPETEKKGSVSNAVIELVARPVEGRELKSAALAYDVWLDAISGDGDEEPGRLSLAAGQGEAAPFVFAPRRIPVARVGDKPVVARVAIDGAITGRASPDGEIVLSVLARRRSAFAQDAEGRRGWTGSEEGSREIVVRDGETVRIELPPAEGSETLRPVPAGLTGPFAPGVSEADGELILDWGKLLAGREGALVITARRLQ